MTFNKSKLASRAALAPVATVLFVATTAVTHAHPGHDVTESSASHIATSPYHLIVAGLMLLIGTGLASLLWASRRRQSGRPAQIRK